MKFELERSVSYNYNTSRMMVTEVEKYELEEMRDTLSIWAEAERGKLMEQFPVEAKQSNYSKPSGGYSKPSNSYSKPASQAPSGAPAERGSRSYGSAKQWALVDKHIAEGNRNGIQMHEIHDYQGLQRAIKLVFGN